MIPSKSRVLVVLTLSMVTLAMAGCNSSTAPPATEETKTESLAAPNHPTDANPPKK